MPLERLLVLVALLANVALELPAMWKTEIHFVLKSQWLQEYCIKGDLTFDDVIPVGGVVDKLDHDPSALGGDQQHSHRQSRGGTGWTHSSFDSIILSIIGKASSNFLKLFLADGFGTVECLTEASLNNQVTINFPFFMSDSGEVG